MTLRDKVAKLASARPDLRKHLVPLLSRSAAVGDDWTTHTVPVGPVVWTFDGPGVEAPAPDDMLRVSMAARAYKLALMDPLAKPLLFPALFKKMSPVGMDAEDARGVFQVSPKDVSGWHNDIIASGWLQTRSTLGRRVFVNPDSDVEFVMANIRTWLVVPKVKPGMRALDKLASTPLTVSVDENPKGSTWKGAVAEVTVTGSGMYFMRASKWAQDRAMYIKENTSKKLVFGIKPSEVQDMPDWMAPSGKTAGGAPTAAQMLSTLQDLGLHPDKVSRKGDVYTARFGYFYRNGQTPQKWAAAIANVMPIEVVGTRDEFAAWPKDSYLRVDFKLAPAP